MTNILPPDHPLSILWLVRCYPYPAHSGDKLYSSKLIEALAARGAAITAFCPDDAEGGAAPPPDGPAQMVEWVRVPDDGASRLWAYPFSQLPRQALSLADPARRAALDRLLRRQRWDAVVVDYVSMGWTLSVIEACWPERATRPPLVYLSHNHEASLRRITARASTLPALKRLAQRIDARRVAALEERLVAAAALVTANTDADRDLFRDAAPDVRCEVLMPGYDGPVMHHRTLNRDTPRRVVVVGSFFWIVKQQNMNEFLEAAAKPLAERGIGIDVVGHGPADLLTAWRRRYSSVTIHGEVDKIEPFVQGARISVIPERLGGGFKNKVLNAVFQRSPVFALAGSITGAPLVDGHSVRLCDGFSALVQAIATGIDDLAALNDLQENAFAACAGRFNWADRGRALDAAIKDVRQNREPRPGCDRDGA